MPMPSCEANPSESSSSPELQQIIDLVEAQAHQATGNTAQLLALLRSLEALHKQIREGLFQDALPTNRQALYALLREVEATGGWPYIPRMRLREILKQLEAGDRSS